MAKRKLSLEEAFAVFEQHGLQVSVKAIQSEPPVQLSDFLEDNKEDITKYPPIRTGKDTVKVTLYAKHTVGSGGELVTNSDGSKQVKNSGIQTYGPGIVTVPTSLAQHLLHQDAVARATDERTFDGKFRSYAIIQKGSTSVGVQVGETMGFDLSGFLGSLGEQHIQRF